MCDGDAESVCDGDTGSVCNVSASDISDIGQLDGNTSICSDTPQLNKNGKPDKITAALCLPVVATYNCRSLFPKIRSLKKDLLERKIDVGFCQEIWQQTKNSEHRFEIEKMLQIDGLQYISTTRPPNRKGVSYGGAAIIVNSEKFTCEKLKVHIPGNLEAVRGLLRPRAPSAKFKKK